MNMRAIAVVTSALMALSLTAPAAMARGLAPGEAEWVITPDDLSTPTGRVMDSMTNEIGRTIPTGCSNVNSGKTASGRNSLSTVIGEIDYRNGTTWQSTVWTYRTNAAARASFRQLQARSLKLCNDRFSGLIGDDVPDMPAVLVDSAQKVPGATQPRFSVSTSQILTDPENARPGYSNAHSFRIFTLVDNAIVQVNVFQVNRVTMAQRDDAGHATTAIAQRYAAST